MNITDVLFIGVQYGSGEGAWLQEGRGTIGKGVKVTTDDSTSVNTWG